MSQAEKIERLKRMIRVMKKAVERAKLGRKKQEQRILNRLESELEKITTT